MAPVIRTQDVVQLCVCTVGIVANVVSILATSHVPRTRWTAYNKLIINLAISDIFVPAAVTLHILSAIFTPNDQCTETVRRFLLNVALTSTLFNLVLMAVDHFLANMHPMRYEHLFSKLKVNIAIVCLWGASVGIGLIEIAVSYANYNGDVAKQLSFCEHLNMEGLKNELIVIIFIFVVLLILIVVYIRLYCLVKRMISRDVLEGRQSNSFKATVTTFLIISSFALCWCPLALFHFTLYVKPPNANDDIEQLLLINNTLFTLLLFNSICDPAIYAIRRSEVKQGYVRLFRRLARPSLDYEREGSFLFRRRNTGPETVTDESTMVARLSLSSPEASKGN